MLKESYSKREDSFIVLSIVALVILIVAGVTYSAYLLINAMHISNIAGVHVTQNLKMAANGATGKLFSDEQNGIKDWIVYTDQDNGFELKYPNDLVLQKGDGQHLLTLKKNSINLSENSNSLSSVMYIDVKDGNDGKSIREEMNERGIDWDDNWNQQWLGGKPGIKTGRVKDEAGVVKELVVWQLGGKIFVLEGDCFNLNSHESLQLFDKIVSQFKFI